MSVITPDLQAIRKQNERRLLFDRLRRYRFIYLMMIPVLAYFLIFSYYPMALGIYNSFREIKLLGNATFVGWKNYQTIFASPVYSQAFVNTLVVGAGTFLLQTAWGLVLALAMSELRRKISRSFFQTISYIPNLLSWSVVGSIWITLLSPTGLLNSLLELIGGEEFRTIVFMSERNYARSIMIFTGAWKGAGYTAALLMAAIVAIDPTLYEAASIDGATRFQQITRITVPCIVPTIKTVVVLGVMGILRNFDQIFIMSNSSILDKVRNLLYLIYNDGIVQFKVGPASAAATIVLLATMVISFFVRRLIGYDK
ncbi:MAG: sugar ABC transporter permease [Clostridia bacterium]|nr:sugar ABC transporter permease [Clostridia bacterium]